MRVSTSLWSKLDSENDESYINITATGGKLLAGTRRDIVFVAGTWWGRRGRVSDGFGRLSAKRHSFCGGRRL